MPAVPAGSVLPALGQALPPPQSLQILLVPPFQSSSERPIPAGGRDT